MLNRYGCLAVSDRNLRHFPVESRAVCSDFDHAWLRYSLSLAVVTCVCLYFYLYSLNQVNVRLCGHFDGDLKNCWSVRKKHCDEDNRPEENKIITDSRDYLFITAGVAFLLTSASFSNESPDGHAILHVFAVLQIWRFFTRFSCD